jgi:hypothetical protein
MKRLLAYMLLVLVLTFDFQSLTKADDIRDFEIEGMSIGDSALDFFSEREIKKNKKNWYKDKKFYGVEIKSKSEKFDSIQLHFKTGDNKYIINAVGGLVFFKNKIDKCHSLKKTIDKDIKNLFKNARISEKGKRKHSGDKSGKSFTYDTYYYLKNGNVFSGCYDWSKKMRYTDNFRLIVNTKEINKWYSRAY